MCVKLHYHQYQKTELIVSFQVKIQSKSDKAAKPLDQSAPNVAHIIVKMSANAQHSSDTSTWLA